MKVKRQGEDSLSFIMLNVRLAPVVRKCELPPNDTLKKPLMNASGPVGGSEHVERQAQQQPWGCMLLLAAAEAVGRREGPECPWSVHDVGDLGGLGGVEQAP